MNDEELLAQLRRTLSERAAGLRPDPGSLPAPGATHPGAPEPAPEPASEPAAGAYDRDPTGRMRILRMPGRSRPILAAGAVLAAAAAAAAAVSFAVSGPNHSKLTFTTQQTAPAAPAPTAPPPTAAAAGTVPPTTLAPAPDAVPVGFEALSVTFVSADDGWAIGRYRCGAGSGSGTCPALAATTDGGLSWSARPAPPVPPAALAPGGTVAVRFADRRDGWVTSRDGLWSTHDGGQTWGLVPNPSGNGGRILDLEAAAGRAYLVAIGPGYSVEEVYSTPVTADQWTASPVRPGVGAGPVPTAQLVLDGRNGWLVDVDRTTNAGARIGAGGAWQAWTPPCSGADGPGVLAAASSTELVAVCGEGLWGTPDAGTTAGQAWLFRSVDGGDSFSAVGALPVAASDAYAVTTAPGDAATVVVATLNGLVASFDGGATWTDLHTAGAQGKYAGADFVGFTTATQGVAIMGDGPGTTMLMTRDGGHTWEPVDFQS